ncbi:hypothetical protein Q8A67_007262 [Cirrhinus molitorella]|uniref:Uncharacterized protein n=1 Tax=Cirrhinus molitorella TaxID=172907 RepID=A0AA88PYU5_9TELE|nr:hypothetical protein Q8A67_007262 [Cirrhinus molitorella]
MPDRMAAGDESGHAAADSEGSVRQESAKQNISIRCDGLFTSVILKSEGLTPLPPGSSPPYLPPGSSPAHLPPGSSPAHLPPGSSPAHLPPSSYPPYLPPSSSPAHLPSGSSPPYLPPGSSPAHLPPRSSPPYLPPGSSPPYLQPGPTPAIHGVNLHSDEMPSTSGSIVGQLFSPSLIRPFPKAGPRKETGRGRKQRLSEILTDTPVKLALEEEEHRKGKNIRKKILGSEKSKKDPVFEPESVRALAAVFKKGKECSKEIYSVYSVEQFIKCVISEQQDFAFDRVQK